jgi:hypothetical protein
MSEEFVSGCIQHRDTRHLRLYYDYMDIYSDNEYKAKIIRILETWTDHKRAEWYKTNSDRLEQGQEFLEPDFWITMSYQQFRYYMRHTASEDTLKKALVELEQAKHIKRRVNPDFPYGPPQYLLNSKVIQAALNKLSTPPLVPDPPPQEDTPPPGKNIPPQEITPTQGVELPPPRGEKTREGGRKNTPTQGGKFGTSNITTKNYLEDVIDSDKEESTGEQNEKGALASPHVDAALPDFPLITYADCITYLKLRGVSPQGDAVQVMVQARTLYVSDHNETQSQGDAHATTPLHRPFGMAADQPVLPGEAIAASQSRTPGDLEASHGVQPVSERAVPTTRPVLEAAPEIDLDFLNAETEHRQPAIPKSAIPPGGTSHEQNRDASPRNVAVEADLGVVSSAPIPPALPEVSPPRTMRATVVSPPPQVLVVSQQFSSVEDWKQAQESFVEQLRGIWKTTSPDFKRQASNWNAYRRQYLDRWLKANPEPTAESLLSPEERRIWQDWQTNYKGPIPLTASDKQALVMLLPINPSREELKAERGWLFSTDDPKKPWYRKIGVSLMDCAKNWSKWQSLQEPEEKPEKTGTRTLTREELRRMPV